MSRAFRPMQTTPARSELRRSIVLVALLSVPACGGAPPGASQDQGGPGGGDALVHPDSLGRWALPDRATGGATTPLRLEDLGVGPARFTPLRARYLQTMHDTPGVPASRLLVTIQVDRAVQSGAWDGRYPAVIPGLREPGLLVDWQIQNSIYNAFDRVLTDQHLGMRQRVMPGGASVAGLVIGAVVDGIHSRRVTDPTASPGEPGGTQEAVSRVALTDATVNVLTAPFVLSQMPLVEGQVFTLPGYALIGGPEGAGTPWVGLYEVLTVSRSGTPEAPRRVMEVLAARRPAGWSGPSDVRTANGRVTRMVVTDQPPYLLAREDYQIEAGGAVTPIREHLHLVDWAPLPLPGADLVPEGLWRIDLDGELFDLEPSRLPRVHRPER